MRPTVRQARLAAVPLAAAALGACSGSLDINMTDTPVDGAASVVIVFTGIELHDATNGKTVSIQFANPRRIDLLQLRSGATVALLQSHTVLADKYDWIKLDVLADKDTQGESYITLTTGAQYPLYIPAGSETGLTLTSPFKVGQGQTTQLIIEFDLRQSVTATDGQNYLLVPAMRMADQSRTGTVTAALDLTAMTAQQLGAGAQVSQCAGGLFIFSGAAVTPQNGGGASLVDIQPVPDNGASTQVSLSIPYLAEGRYTIAATCDYGLYDPAAVPGQTGYQRLHWTVLDDVSVTANTTTTATLPSATTTNIVN